MDQIEIKVLTLRRAIEINSMNANREFVITEIMLGAGSHRKAVAYTPGLLQYGTIHKAEITSPGKIRII